jgi:hypothetical protein
MNYEAIEQCVKDEIANPKGCYLPNTPAGAVNNRLLKAGYKEEAKYFWDCVVWRRPFGVDSLDELMLKLNSLNKNERMPEWGTYGT